MRRILTWPKRKWRSKGFGIHSPFAFEFVTKVLAKGDAPLLDRINRFMHTANIAAVCNVSADAGVMYHAPTRPCIIADDVSGTLTHDCLPGVYIFRNIDKIENEARWKKITVSSPCGMDFSDYRTGILCRFPHLPRQSFKIIIRN